MADTFATSFGVLNYSGMFMIANNKKFEPGGEKHGQS